MGRKLQPKMPAKPNPERQEPVQIPLDPEEALLLAVKLDDDTADEFVAAHPDLVPTLRLMLSYAVQAESDSTKLGEFCREWLANQEPTTPHRLTAFVNAGIISESPRGTGSGRSFYVLRDCSAVERALIKLG